MDDKAIIDLYFSRSETAIAATADKYGGYCYSIAYNILTNNEDSEECVSDTYLAAWNTMPPRRPSVLASFLGKITRYISIDRWRAKNTCKRGGGEIVLALEELEDCTGDGDTPEKTFERKELALLFNRFLDSLPQVERRIFLCRYWYLDSVENIAGYFGFSTSKVYSMLHRTRGKLRLELQKEGLL